MKKYRIPRIQPTNRKKCNKQKGPSENVSIPIGRETKMTIGGRRKKSLGWERGGREERGNRITKGEGTGE